MNLRFLLSAAFLLLIFLVSCNQGKPTHEGEWIKLFNGKDINDWTVKVHHYEPGVNVGNTFRVEDNMIKVRYDQYDNFNDQFSHLYYNQPFSHFHLIVEYRFTGELQKGAPEYTLLNSGVMYHSQDPRSMKKEQNWPISVEMQFLAGLGDGQAPSYRQHVFPRYGYRLPGKSVRWSLPELYFQNLWQR